MKGVTFEPALAAQSEQVVHALLDRQLTIVTAESCTAGLLAALLADAEGSSKALQGGFVVYTKTQKTQALGVSAALLRATGAVTEQVAAAMAGGALSRSAADIAIAITGVLGPAPDEDGNPVGLAFIALRDRSGYHQGRRLDFGADDHQTLCARTLSAALLLVTAYLASRQTIQVA